MVRTSDQVFGGPALRAFLAPTRISTRDGRGDSVGRSHADIFECDHYKTPPDGGAFLREEREYGSLRRRNFTSMDGLCSRLIGASWAQSDFICTA